MPNSASERHFGPLDSHTLLPKEAKQAEVIGIVTLSVTKNGAALAYTGFADVQVGVMEYDIEFGVGKLEIDYVLDHKATT